MKFTCERIRFSQSVAIAAKAVASKPSSPILSGIYIKATNDELELHSTDNETSIIVKLTGKDGVNITEPGEAVFVGRYFQEVVRNLPGETITVDCNSQEKTVKIASGSLKYTLMVMSSEEFPAIRPIDGELNISISDKILRNMISRTNYACSQDNARPIFTGCAMEIQENTIRMAATNTFQLAVQSSVLDDYYEGRKSIVIPGKVLSAVEKMLVSEVPTDVKIGCNSRQISFQYDNVYIVTRLIEGNFPDYNRVIPLDFATRVTMNTSEFAASLRRINVIANTSEYKSVKFEFTNSSVRISASNPDIGYSEEIIPAVIDGDDITISFNSSYLLTVMGVVKSESFILSLNNAVSAASIREIDDSSFTYIITPIRNS